MQPGRARRRRGGGGGSFELGARPGRGRSGRPERRARIWAVPSGPETGASFPRSSIAIVRLAPLRYLQLDSTTCCTLAIDLSLGRDSDAGRTAGGGRTAAGKSSWLGDEDAGGTRRRRAERTAAEEGKWWMLQVGGERNGGGGPVGGVGWSYAPSPRDRPLASEPPSSPQQDPPTTNSDPTTHSTPTRRPRLDPNQHHATACISNG